MTQVVNQENMLVIFHFGLKFLFDGYLIKKILNKIKYLIIITFLFDGYLIDLNFNMNERSRNQSGIN